MPSLLMGVGLGGFIDGIVLRQILGIHHVRDDLGFLAFGALLALVGWMMIRRASGSPSRSR